MERAKSTHGTEGAGSTGSAESAEVTEFNRRRLLRGAIGAAAAAALPAGTATVATAATVADAVTAATPPHPQPPSLWAEFKRNPHAHPHIPYIGRAGYRGGVTAFPRPRVVADIVKDYGALPDGSADAAPAINRALQDAGRRGGGTVFVPPGTYRIDDIIRIGHNNVVLRGAGSGRTTLHATRSLTDLIGPYGSRYGGDKSSWSWAGGLIWLCPNARWESLTDAIKAKAWPFEGWTGNRRDEWRTLTPLTAVARQGDRTVTVQDTRHLRPGDRVLLQLADDADHTLLQHMAGDLPGASAYTWSDKTKLTSYVPYEWPCRITAVDPRRHRITLDRPLPLDTRPSWNPQLTTHIAPLAESGVESLTLEMAETPQSPHLLDKGYNGVALQCAWDCWVDDVHVRHVDNGFLLVAAKACTLRRTRVSGRGSHHPYACREGSHDNLVEDFTIDRRTVPAPAGTQLHGINVEGLSSYNVWSRGHMAMGTFDTHRGLPFANVRTDITVTNDGAHGGDASAGPLYGARFTHWNITVTNHRAGCIKLDEIAPYSATVAISEVSEFGQTDKPDFTGPLHTRLESYGRPESLTPRNLHEAQRALRR
ncbi:glycoside hydrolase family 55 protein [Streptomyces inhibens]|uniref:glycoside hydrolase family 55 protein n=1 Tax=Streptomyces inhibens TaxID=2293571 RepID=UPI001EE75C3D|nr:glycoside hydrolase family 55 protein [Streptomyces inhibens]UKY52056.1 glycoside hydrolase family 55 protein [Streptomyces inhibens]